jgi:hypothetical protein
MIAAYFVSPEGQKKIHQFLSSTEGKEIIRKYLTTPVGQQLAHELLSVALDGLDIPADLKETIRAALGKEKPGA